MRQTEFSKTQKAITTSRAEIAKGEGSLTKSQEPRSTRVVDTRD